MQPLSTKALKHLAKLHRALAQFLDHYSARPVHNKPWRLVINGDMVDFLTAGLTGQENALGLYRGELTQEQAVDWLQRVVRRERRVFRALARFLAAGHSLVIIKGNHDVQFHWPRVQEILIESLCNTHAEALERNDSRLSSIALKTQPDEISGRIHFCDWFYYEDGLVYIEHGNQYDDYCSYEHVLAPIDEHSYNMEDPISHRTYREFASMLQGMLDLHSIDRWTFFDFLRWSLSLAPRLLAKLAYTYLASVAFLVSTKRRLINAAKNAKRRHLERRAQLSHRFGIQDEIVHRLDELRKRPAGRSIFRGLCMLYLDRVFLLGLNFFLGIVCLFLPVDWMMRMNIFLGSLGLSLAANLVLDRLRDVPSHPKLQKMAKEVARVVRVPFIIFGHTHVPVAEKTAEATSEDSSWYLNTGSWTVPTGLTHVCVLAHEESPLAELRRWCPKTRSPELVSEAGLSGRLSETVGDAPSLGV